MRHEGGNHAWGSASGLIKCRLAPFPRTPYRPAYPTTAEMTAFRLHAGAELRDGMANLRPHAPNGAALRDPVTLDCGAVEFDDEPRPLRRPDRTVALEPKPLRSFLP